MASSPALSRLKTVSSPPPQRASPRVSAPRGPPPTGASSIWIPRASNTAWIRRTSAGELVVRSKYTLPAASPARRPCAPSATASTSGGPGSDVNTTCVASATSRGVSAQPAPAFRCGADASGRTSWTTSSWPALIKLDAMWRPMVPSPMNPIFMAGIRMEVCSGAALFFSCCCLDLPDVRIRGDEPRRVHPELGDELAARALVPIGRVIDAAVTLFERLEGEAREAKPGRLHFGLLSDRQPQPANRKQVGGRAELELDVDGARHGGTLCSIEPPAPRRVGRELDLYCVVADPARDPCGHGVPPRIADDRVVKPARLLVVGKDRRAAQMPVGMLDKQSTELMARLIQSPPEDRLAGRLFPTHDGAIIASAFAGSGRLCCWSILRRQRGDPCTKST